MHTFRGIKTKMKVDTKLTVVMWCQIFDQKSTTPSGGHFRRRRSTRDLLLLPTRHGFSTNTVVLKSPHLPPLALRRRQTQTIRNVAQVQDISNLKGHQNHVICSQAIRQSILLNRCICLLVELHQEDPEQQHSEGAKEDSGTFWLVGTLWLAGMSRVARRVSLQVCCFGRPQL